MAGLFSGAEAGKGFLEGRHLKVTDAAYVVFDGEGNWDRESTCLFLELTDMEGKLNDPVSQYYSIGSPGDFIPQEKGNSFKRNKENISKICNLYHFLVSLINAGVPEEFVDGLDKNAKSLIGMEFRMGTTIRSKKDKSGLPTVDEIFVMPGDNNPEAKAVALIEGILADNGGSVAIRKTLPTKVTEALADVDKDEAKAIRKLALNGKFLKANFTVEGDVVTA